MSTEIVISARYAGQTFLVQPLGQNLARALVDFCTKPMVCGTVPAPIIENDVVRLSHMPTDKDDIPTVVELVSKAGPRFLSAIACLPGPPLYRLLAIALILGATEVWGAAEMSKTEEDLKETDDDAEGNLGSRALQMLHDESIDMQAVGRLIGAQSFFANLGGPPINLCKVACFTEGQANKVAAVGLVLGAELIHVLEGPTELEKPYEVLLFQSDGIDMVAIAQAAGLTRDPSENGDPLLREMADESRNAISAGSEWGNGAWS